MVIDLVQSSENVKIKIASKHSEFRKCMYAFLMNVFQTIYITVIPGVEYNSKNHFKMYLLSRLRFELQSTVILQNVVFSTIHRGEISSKIIFIHFYRCNCAESRSATKNSHKTIQYIEVIRYNRTT